MIRQIQLQDLNTSTIIEYQSLRLGRRYVMPLLRSAIIVAVSTFVSIFAPSPTALADDPSAAAGDDNTSGVRTLTVIAVASETERGVGDTPPTGLSKGDTFVSNAPIHDLSGAVVGSYHVACTITDEEDNDGNAWSICSTTASIEGSGTLVASGLTQLLQVATSPGGFGVAPPTAEICVGRRDGFLRRRPRRSHGDARHLGSQAGLPIPTQNIIPVSRDELFANTACGERLQRGRRACPPGA